MMMVLAVVQVVEADDWSIGKLYGECHDHFQMCGNNPLYKHAPGQSQNWLDAINVYKLNAELSKACQIHLKNTANNNKPFFCKYEPNNPCPCVTCPRNFKFHESLQWVTEIFASPPLATLLTDWLINLTTELDRLAVPDNDPVLSDPIGVFCSRFTLFDELITQFKIAQDCPMLFEINDPNETEKFKNCETNELKNETYLLNVRFENFIKCLADNWLPASQECHPLLRRHKFFWIIVVYARRRKILKRYANEIEIERLMRDFVKNVSITDSLGPLNEWNSLAGSEGSTHTFTRVNNKSPRLSTVQTKTTSRTTELATAAKMSTMTGIKKLAYLPVDDDEENERQRSIDNMKSLFLKGVIVVVVVVVLIACLVARSF
jgi:hypothetical protein